MTPLQTKNLVTKVLDEHKAEDITCINVGKLTALADYVIICSATSTRHIRALVEHLITTCKEHKVRPLGAEGVDGTHEWALVDLGDIIVHIMLKTTRSFYCLEELWQANKTTARDSNAPKSKTKPKKTVKKPRKQLANKKTKTKTHSKTLRTKTRIKKT